MSTEKTPLSHEHPATPPPQYAPPLAPSYQQYYPQEPSWHAPPPPVYVEPEHYEYRHYYYDSQGRRRRHGDDEDVLPACIFFWLGWCFFFPWICGSYWIKSPNPLARTAGLGSLFFLGSTLIVLFINLIVFRNHY